MGGILTPKLRSEAGFSMVERGRGEGDGQSSGQGRLTAEF